MPGTPGTAGSAALTAGGWLRWLVLCLGVTYLFNFVSLGITALLGMLKGGAVQNPLALMQMEQQPAGHVSVRLRAGTRGGGVFVPQAAVR